MDPADEVPTAAQLRKLRVVDLRKKLQKLELTQSGNKEDLITRLRQYYLEQQAKREAEEEVKNEEAEEETVMEEGGKEEREEREGESVSEIATVQDGEGTMEEAIVDMETEVTKEEEDMTIKQSSSEEMPQSVVEPSSEINTDDVITDDVIETNNDIIPDKEKEVPSQAEESRVGLVQESDFWPVQSMDGVVPKPDTVPPSTVSTVTSDYYSDSAREEIAQDHIPMVQPATPSQETPVVPTSNTERTSTAHFKDGQEPKGKKKKKKRRRRRHTQGAESGGGAREGENEPPPDVEIEYVQEDLLKPGDIHYKQFHKIFEMFKLTEGSDGSAKTTPTNQLDVDDESMSIAAKSSAAQKKQRDEEESEDEEEGQKEPAKLSKKKLRKLNRLSVAQLKQLVDRPDVVEMHDVTAQDPKLLILLKSTRNTVPVPRHWCFKRKYLQGKRGIEKPPFNLPDFIKATGIMEMRQALEEKEDAKSLKQKTRERVRPKMGKLTIDYQKLHDAFFRWQTKPKMTIHGDLYYEGKEFETRLREKKPGDLSDELRRALGMPTGMGKQKFPPPWLVAMQRYGPPPSYPNLKIPGLNAPIPEGCSFGYFVGGWGKPPVDEVGRPLYGDVFGLDNADNAQKIHDEDIDKHLWGELESEEEMEEEEESEDEEGEMKPEDLQAGLITPLEGGLVTPSGLTSIPAGLETPEMIQLRKKKIEEAMEQGGDTPALYTVLPEKSQSVGGAVMGSSHVYDISAAVPGANKKAGSGAGGEGVEVALDPSELDLDAATMTARYEEQLKETKLQKEDLSDMVAEHAAKQKKRKRTTTDSGGGGGGKASKKLKEFKF